MIQSLAKPAKEVVAYIHLKFEVRLMSRSRLLGAGVLGSLVILCAGFPVVGQNATADQEFGPVVRAYLGYLKNEQEVVDDRVSKREVTPSYYRRNSNRIRALRLIAVQIARESQNDYLPELEAVTGDEARLLFEHPPRLQALRIGEVVQNTLRYLGVVRSGETFYIFARLDPYEQAEVMQRTNHNGNDTAGLPVATPISGAKMTRARRVSTP